MLIELTQSIKHHNLNAIEQFNSLKPLINLLTVQKELQQLGEFLNLYDFKNANISLYSIIKLLNIPLTENN